MESFKSVLSTSWHSHQGQEQGEGAQEGGSRGGGRSGMLTTSWGAKSRRKNYLQPQAGLQQAHKTLFGEICLLSQYMQVDHISVHLIRYAFNFWLESLISVFGLGCLEEIGQEASDQFGSVSALNVWMHTSGRNHFMFMLKCVSSSFPVIHFLQIFEPVKSDHTNVMESKHQIAVSQINEFKIQGGRAELDRYHYL